MWLRGERGGGHRYEYDHTHAHNQFWAASAPPHNVQGGHPVHQASAVGIGWSTTDPLLRGVASQITRFKACGRIGWNTRRAPKARREQDPVRMGHHRRRPMTHLEFCGGRQEEGVVGRPGHSRVQRARNPCCVFDTPKLLITMPFRGRVFALWRQYLWKYFRTTPGSGCV